MAGRETKTAATKQSGNNKLKSDNKIKRRKKNKAEATKKIKRREIKIKRRGKIKPLQQNKFILQCNFIYLEFLTFSINSHLLDFRTLSF